MQYLRFAFWTTRLLKYPHVKYVTFNKNLSSSSAKPSFFFFFFKLSSPNEQTPRRPFTASFTGDNFFMLIRHGSVKYQILKEPRTKLKVEESYEVLL